MLTLPAVLDLTSAASLKAELLAALARGDGLEIDGSEVQRITTPCLQVLASAARAFAQAGGPPLKFSKKSPALLEVASVLALGSPIGDHGTAHE